MYARGVSRADQTFPRRGRWLCFLCGIWTSTPMPCAQLWN